MRLCQTRVKVTQQPRDQLSSNVIELQETELEKITGKKMWPFAERRENSKMLRIK